MSIRETEKGINPTNLSSEHIPTDNSHHSHHQLPHLKVVAPNLRLRQIIRIKNEPSSAKKIQMLPSSKKDVLPSNKMLEVGPSSGHSLRDNKDFMCLICMNQKLCNEKLYVCECEHMHDYCEDCMNHYTLYRINQFQEVTCPNPACDVPIDTSLPFFQQLPTRIQQRYRHVHQFHLTHKDNNIKLCPADKCDGVIKKESPGDRVMICSTCQKHFCSQCLLVQHEGDCDAFQIHFLEENLNYKKCQQCGIIIEKQEGCNHVTCICGHDFCYLCGESWTNDHDKPHDDNNKVHASHRSRMNKDNPSYRQVERTDSDAQFYLMTVLKTFLRILLFPFKLMGILMLVLVLVVYSLVMLMVAIFFCVCIVCSQDCYDIYSRVGGLGGQIVELIRKLWDY